MTTEHSNLRMEEKIDIIWEAMRRSPMFSQYMTQAAIDLEIAQAEASFEDEMRQYDGMIRTFIGEIDKEGRLMGRIQSYRHLELTYVAAPDAPDYIRELVEVLNADTIRPFPEALLTKPAFRAECERLFGPVPDLNTKVEQIKAKYYDSF